MKVFVAFMVAALTMGACQSACALDGGDAALSPADVARAIGISREIFRNQRGTWLLERVSRVSTVLDGEGDSVEVTLFYDWGGEKRARFFCGYDELGRLGCDPVFSGPGALY